MYKDCTTLIVNSNSQATIGRVLKPGLRGTSLRATLYLFIRIIYFMEYSRECNINRSPKGHRLDYCTSSFKLRCSGGESSNPRLGNSAQFRLRARVDCESNAIPVPPITVCSANNRIRLL